jgi:hypothetical protein
MEENFEALFGCKSIIIRGPWGLDMEIEYDDVDHDIVDAEVDKLVSLLNREWAKSQ